MAGNFEELDAAFTLPDAVEDNNLRALYEVIVARMRTEASHLPMNTVQMLLIERIAYNYIVLKAKENNEMGGFASANVQKDYNTFWLSMTAEFNRLLGKVEPLKTADRNALLRDVHQIIVNTVTSVVTDPQGRADLLKSLADEFQKSGI